MNTLRLTTRGQSDVFKSLPSEIDVSFKEEDIQIINHQTGGLLFSFREQYPLQNIKIMLNLDQNGVSGIDLFYIDDIAKYRKS
ncbi:MAG: hypothetical protein HDS02_01375 [Bacteroides sp.]|nr:hypothetical protein [Bacteroides sp.]